MANLYYREELSAAEFVSGAELEVVGDEAHHAVRVSRLRVGEHIMLGNGAGSLGLGEVIAADKQRFVVRLAEVQQVPSPRQRITLVQALAKGDRDERAVEQATEFGIDAIQPWGAARSVSRWAPGEKTERGVAKWQRIAREAAKQSLRPWTPDVLAPTTLAELAQHASREGSEVLVLHPRGLGTLSGWAAVCLTQEVRDLFLVVGPEGGFDDSELEALDTAGAQILTLGSTVLRTSSAGPAGLAVLNLVLGRW
ncbi:16S rRNA (uracil1498-N3)-methyltransferase [Leucobacter luti]|uniref:Ribosomal RNA small subunit methyltransferase E n=1 Tax=Leucobacter luti TaxID=340320 RepID=A0A4R6RTH2_9MICO|nr:16S rRNA (uracil(1498)-N(3))-methyltransferase [Leucobacter luti]TDP90219.1 16S rRNA (uracil1498-N3)-methyltransferase [Leucobacter luti]